MFNHNRKLTALRYIVAFAVFAQFNVAHADDVEKLPSQDAELQLAVMAAPGPPKLAFIIRNRTDHEIIPHMAPGTFFRFITQKQGEKPVEYRGPAGSEDPSLVRQIKPGETYVTMFDVSKGFANAHEPGIYEAAIVITDGSYMAKDPHKAVSLKTNTVVIYIPDPNVKQPDWIIRR